MNVWGALSDTDPRDFQSSGHNFKVPIISFLDVATSKNKMGGMLAYFNTATHHQIRRVNFAISRILRKP